MTRKDWKHEKSNLHAPCPADDAGSFRRLRQAEQNADHRHPCADRYADSGRNDRRARSAEDTADQPASEEPITLTFWTPTWRQAAEEAIIAELRSKVPDIKIEATYLSSADIKTNTKIAASSNTLPDMWYNWGGAFADYYAENGLCLDLTDYANEHNWSDRFLAGALEQATLRRQDHRSAAEPDCTGCLLPQGSA